MNQLDYALDDVDVLFEQLNSAPVEWEVDPADLAIAMARPEFQEVVKGHNMFQCEMRVIVSAASIAGYHVVGETGGGPRGLEYIVRFEKKREEP